MNDRSAYTILQAEDDPLLRKLATRYLQEKGFQVLEATNGLEAWEIFQDKRPELLLTDLGMPVMDGFQLMAKIAAEAPDTSIVVLSGIGTMDDVIEALRLGACDYLTKPLASMELLLHSVNRAIQRFERLYASRRYQEILEQTVLNRTEKLEEELRERKKVEQLVLRAKQEWERTVDAMPDLIAMLDINQRIVRLNKPMAAAMGLTPKEAVGMYCYTCLHNQKCPPEDCPHLRLLADGQPHSIEIFEEHLGGYFEVMVIPRYATDDTTLIGSIHIAHDITARKEAEKEQQKLHTQLLHAQKMESVGRLAAGIAHEINTPTQYVGSNLDFLDDSFRDLGRLTDQFQVLLQAAENNTLSPQLIEDTRQELDQTDWTYLSKEIPTAIEQSREGIRRVSSIVRAMKEFSHPGSKEKTPTNLNAIIDTTITVSRNEWKYVADIKTDLDASLPPVQCLSDELGQAILNILVNAAHAIGDKLGDNPDGQKGTIELSTRQVEEGVELRISDTGCGIPEAIRQQIFDPFFTTKKVGQGTGQGLAIVHDVITGKHHGSIRLESEPGVGTTFIIQLPINHKLQ